MIVHSIEIIHFELNRNEAKKLAAFLDPAKPHIYLENEPKLRELLENLNRVLED